MRRTWIALLLAASIAAGQSVKDSYNKAKRKRGDRRQQFAAEWAEEHDGAVKGIGYLYLGLLWQYAENWDKAVEAFRGYLKDAKPTAKTSAAWWGRSCDSRKQGRRSGLTPCRQQPERSGKAPVWQPSLRR